MPEIKELRKQLGWSVNELADHIEVTDRTVRRWEYGKIPTPKAVTLLLTIYKSNLTKSKLEGVE